MVTERHLDAMISRWLEETAPAGLPDRVLQTTFERTRRSRQHVDWRAALGGSRLTRSVLALGGAAVVVMAVALALNFTARLPAVGGPLPVSDPRSSFLGTWFSADADGSALKMTVRASGEDALEIVVRDTLASVCSGATSTMIGTGRLGAAGELVIPAPAYACDDGSKPEALSGPPLEEQLRNLTFLHDPRTETLTDNFGAVWAREGAGGPGPALTTLQPIWPQTSLEEVRQAQERADAGDPAYTWQVDPNLSSEEWWGHLEQQGAKIVERFLHDELGWDHGLFWGTAGGDGPSVAEGAIRGIVYLRCAPGETNPLYPIAGKVLGAERCGPTRDELNYETVILDLIQPDRRGSSGIWVVGRSATTGPSFAQADPRVVEKAATARLEDFLGARIQGSGAEGFGSASQSWHMSQELPLLYATSSGAPYERFEIKRADGPNWPFGSMEFNVRLFAQGGATVVEERIRVIVDGGQVELGYLPTATTENGQPVAVLYAWFDGRLTARAADPWAEYTDFALGLALNKNWDERFNLVGNPSPVETGCEPGPAPADAEALARAIRSDPDFETTAPVTVRVGGIEALRMDVIAVPGASVCEAYPAPMVLEPDGASDHSGLALKVGSRMRLYLLDLPEGSSTRILALAIVAPEARFESVIKAATPIVDSLEFHSR